MKNLNQISSLRGRQPALVARFINTLAFIRQSAPAGSVAKTTPYFRYAEVFAPCQPRLRRGAAGVLTASARHRIPESDHLGNAIPAGLRCFQAGICVRAGSLLLALFVMAIICQPSPAAGKSRPPESLKALAGRLHQEGQHLLNLRQDLQQVLAQDTSKDVSSITGMQLIMNTMSLTATRFQCEARLIGVSLFIKDAYASFYRQQRRDALTGLKEVTAGALRDIQKRYAKVTNNAALHIVDLAQDTISDMLRHIDSALRPAAHK